MKKPFKAVLFITSSILIVMLLPVVFGLIYETYDDLGMRAAIDGNLFGYKPASNLVFIKQILACVFVSMLMYTTVIFKNHNLKTRNSRLNQQYFNELVQRDSISSVVLFNSVFDSSQIFPMYPRNHNNIRFRGE